MIEVTLRIDSCHECPYCNRTNIWYTYDMFCGSKDMRLIASDVSYNEEIEPPLWCPYRKERWPIKLWIDDVRPAPPAYEWCRTVKEAQNFIIKCEFYAEITPDLWQIELIDIDHDAGEYAVYGGDYIKLLDWLEKTGRNYPIRIHSMNPVGVANMRRIIERNGWKEIR